LTSDTFNEKFSLIIVFLKTSVYSHVFFHLKWTEEETDVGDELFCVSIASHLKNYNFALFLCGSGIWSLTLEET
jgi:hypothetical protein